MLRCVITIASRLRWRRPTAASRYVDLGIQLLARNRRPDQQPRRAGVHQGYLLSTAQAPVTARAFVEAVGEGKTVLLPGQQGNPGADGVRARRMSLEARGR